MAPLPQIQDTFRCAIRWGPITAVNVMHFHKEDGQANEIASILSARWSRAMNIAIASTQKIQDITITPLGDNSNSYVFVPDSNVKWTGTSSGEPVPNTAAVLSMHTARRGRSYRGRAFLGPIAEGELFSGAVSSATLAAGLVAWNAFGANVVSDGAEHVVASYKNASAFLVLQYTMRSAAGTMRMRQSRLA